MFGSFPGQPWSLTPTKLTGPKEPTTLWNQTCFVGLRFVLTKKTADLQNRSALHQRFGGSKYGSARLISVLSVGRGAALCASPR